jgi:trehalose 6-phosphate synthase/phosphatase
MESVQLVFDYFCERTPRSFVEARRTSLVWNYKHADMEFGRLQVGWAPCPTRLQHAPQPLRPACAAPCPCRCSASAPRSCPALQPGALLLQARDMLQHLWTGPISNAPVEIIQGSKSVEVRPVGVTKGATMRTVVGAMSEMLGVQVRPGCAVLCCAELGWAGPRLLC